MINVHASISTNHNQDNIYDMLKDCSWLANALILKWTFMNASVQQGQIILEGDNYYMKYMYILVKYLA